MPFGQGGGNAQTPADSPRTSRSHRQITRGHTEEADKEIDLDLVDEDKPSGKQIVEKHTAMKVPEFSNLF